MKSLLKILLIISLVIVSLNASNFVTENKKYDFLYKKENVKRTYKPYSFDSMSKTNEYKNFVNNNSSDDKFKIKKATLLNINY